MASIACETGGHYVIVDEETRLQSKVSLYVMIDNMSEVVCL